MRSANTESQVELRKTVNAANDVVDISYHISPTDEDGASVELTETLPQSVPQSAITTDTVSGRWEVCDGRKLRFRDTVTDDEPIRTTLHIASPTLHPADCVSSVRVLSRAEAESPEPSAGRLTDGNGYESVTEVDTDRPDDRPAIGLVGTETNLSAVARTTARAIDHGLAVFIAADPDNGTLARIADRLGATVVEMDGDGWSDDEIATRLARTARQRAHPGILFHGDCREPIAFEASLRAFDESADPVTTPVLEADQTEVLVGIPAFNEADTVDTVVTAASDFADEVLVVDDGSDDGTAARARESGATVVEHDDNRGYGHTLKTIFAEAADRDVDLLVTLDADGQHDPEDIRRLVRKQRECDAEIVIGNRFGDPDSDVPAYRRVGLSVITVLTNLSIGTVGRPARIRDPQSGFRAYDSTVVTALAENDEFIDDRMSASIDILSVATEHGFDTAEVPVTISYDVENASTRNPVTHGMNLVNNIRKTLQRKRPVTVLGVPGVLLVLTGVGVIHWVISEAMARGSLSLELTLLSALLVLTGLLSSVLSIVRHSLNTHVGSAGK